MFWEKEAGEQRVQPGDTAGTGARGLRVGPGASRPDPRPGSTASGLGRLGRDEDSSLGGPQDRRRKGCPPALALCGSLTAVSCCHDH